MNNNFDFFIFKKLIQVLTKNGKKAKALKIVLTVLNKLNNNKEINLSGSEIIYKSFLNIKPILNISKTRKSSKVFYLPKLINEEQQVNLAISWLIKSANSRKEKNIADRLEKEFLDCFFNKGLTINKKHSLYKVILANRPFLNMLVYK